MKCASAAWWDCHQVRDTVAVEVLDPQNAELVLGIVVAIDLAGEFHRGSG